MLFRLNPDGTFAVLHTFGARTDGGAAVAGLVQAPTGTCTGPIWMGGAGNGGVLFRATLAGGVAVLHDFTLATGSWCFSALLQHTNGKLYGETNEGGTSGGAGVFFSLDAGLPPFVTYLPTYGRAGAVVEILGQGFTNTSQVFFNGTPGTVKNVYSTFMKAIVPAGATTGPITVTTSTCTLTSNKVFVVHP